MVSIVTNLGKSGCFLLRNEDIEKIVTKGRKDDRYQWRAVGEFLRKLSEEKIEKN